MQEKREFVPAQNSDDSGIDLGRIGLALLKRLWAIILAAIVFAAAFYFYAEFRYVEKYVSSATLAFTLTTVTVQKDEWGNETGYTTTQVRPLAEKDAERYRFLLKSDLMLQKLYWALGGGTYSEEYIEKSLSVTPTSITDIFTVNVTADDKKFCESAINEIIKSFPAYLKTFDSGLGIEIIKAPKPPVPAGKSNAPKMAFYGFVSGAALVILIVFIKELLSDTVKGAEDIRENIGLRLWGSVPIAEKVNRKKRKNNRAGVLITDEKRAGFAFVEGIKAIRTKLEAAAAEKGYKIFTVTSTFENEGKTTVALNLACALAKKDKSVLLIDCDLRKPSVLNMAGIKEENKTGLIQIIKEKASYEEAIKFIKPLGIFLLPGGGVTQKPTEVLDTDIVKGVLKRARAEFDFVIIDTPPARIVADCLVIAPLSDALIFTIRRDYAKIGDINDTVDEISSAGIEIAGSVFTMSKKEAAGGCLSRRSGRLYPYNRRSYYKGQGGGYGQEENTPGN